jgi:hypothetical protein
MTKIGKKAAQDFFGAVSKVVDRVKTVALWSAKKYMYIKDHKGLRPMISTSSCCLSIGTLATYF